MKRILVGCIAVVVAIASCENRPSPSLEKSEAPRLPKVVVEKEKSDRETPFPPEVKIRLRRDGKDNYSWELSGSDADQILKVNEKLRKKVAGEPSK
jgi:hypothetical protein